MLLPSRLRLDNKELRIWSDTNQRIQIQKKRAAFHGKEEKLTQLRANSALACSQSCNIRKADRLRKYQKFQEKAYVREKDDKIIRNLKKGCFLVEKHFSRYKTCTKNAGNGFNKNEMRSKYLCKIRAFES